MKFDVVIVGAGSAGSVLATRLSEDPARSVALIEAGSDYPYFRDLPEAVKYLGSERSGPAGDEDPARDRPGYDWGFIARATASRPEMPLPRGKVIGGTGSINGYAFLRGQREDFEAWAAMGNTEWTYDKVLPYFRKLENDLNYHEDYHGSSGPMRVSRVLRHNWTIEDHAFEEACLAMGFGVCDDLNRPDGTGVGPTPTASQDGTRMSTARAYLSGARCRENLTIVGDTLIARVVLDGTRATGVQTVTGEIIEAGEVILAAGALKSPHLLLLSGIGPAEQLKAAGIPVVADRPGVGRNVRDHPTVVMMWRKKAGAPAGVPPRNQEGSPRGSAGLRLRFTAPGSGLPDDCTIRSFGSAAMEGHPEREGMYNMNVGLSLARSGGEIRLVSADPATLPSVDLNYLAAESDRRRMRDIIAVSEELVATAGMTKFVGEYVAPGPVDLASDDALDAWMARKVKTSHHVTSGCHIGPASDETAVVDQYGRVHGIDSLRVADASIMPDCTRPNINCTTIMIGERIADFVKAQSR